MLKVNNAPDLQCVVIPVMVDGAQHVTTCMLFTGGCVQFVGRGACATLEPRLNQTMDEAQRYVDQIHADTAVLPDNEEALFITLLHELLAYCQSIAAYARSTR
jgi:hypothetical protein